MQPYSMILIRSKRGTLRFFFLRSVDIMNDRFGLFVQHVRIAEVGLEQLEGGGQIEPVADAFVAYDVLIDVLALYRRSVRFQFGLLIFGAEGQKNRDIAEIIQMMVYRRNAQRTH